MYAYKGALSSYPAKSWYALNFTIPLEFTRNYRAASCEDWLVRNAFVVLLLFAVSGATQTTPSQPPVQESRSTFRNPLLRNGPDPWVIYRSGFYYQMNSTGRNLVIRKSSDITDLRHAATKVVWWSPATGPFSHEIWAPELHFLQNKWYIYFAADAGTNKTHRIWAIENASPDPLLGDWVFKGQLADQSNRWAIDPTVFEEAGQLYAVWSGWKGNRNGQQNLYIAALANPWTVTGKRVKLSSPHFRWEKFGSERDPYVAVNEAPEILKHGGKIFLIYSASGCWTDHYALGMLTAQESSDLLNPKSWTKSREPVFSGSPAAHAYGPGHNGFFPSPDGTQNWIIYHANPEPNQGCDNYRSPRIQPFTWKADGSPQFGVPVPLGEPLPKPSGQQVSNEDQ
jgi:GH43 family beta-xylosidase